MRYAGDGAGRVLPENPMTALYPPTTTSTTPEAAALTYRDVAALLQLSVKSVTRLPVPGRLPLGRAVRFDRAKVLAWIAAGCPAG